MRVPLREWFSTALFAGAVCYVSTAAAQNPPGEVLKFRQLPLERLEIQDAQENRYDYLGHNEFSTAYGDHYAQQFGSANYPRSYMADDFADNSSSPVVHVRWWGSYMGGQNFRGYDGVQKFLISFENDVPASGPDPSHPGSPLLNQVVTKTSAPLTPGSGSFTEATGGIYWNWNANENLYMYDAELAVPFQQQPGQVYWLKIAALVSPWTDDGDPDPNQYIQWGWHSRNYTVKNELASSVPSPGEFLAGTIPQTEGDPFDIWHFQDDAVSGELTSVALQNWGETDPALQQWQVTQGNLYTPMHYVGGAPFDGPNDNPPPNGIGAFSKDLAFELYTVPEPGTLALLASGGLCLLAYAWRKRKRA